MRVHGVATVVQPPEVKETKGGHSLLKLRLMDKNSRKRTQFWDGVVWGEKRIADYLSQGISKGSVIYCDGEIRQDEWGGDDNNSKRISYEINLTELIVLGEAAGMDSSSPASQEEASTEVVAPREPAALPVSDNPFA